MRAGLAAACAALIVGVICGAVLMARQCDSPGLLDAVRATNSIGCFEFWFNRYQTLASGALALLAALIAAILVQQQLDVMRAGQSLDQHALFSRRYVDLQEIRTIGAELRRLGFEAQRSRAEFLRATSLEAVSATATQYAQWTRAIVESVESQRSSVYFGPNLDRDLNLVSASLIDWNRDLEKCARRAAAKAQEITAQAHDERMQLSLLDKLDRMAEKAPERASALMSSQSREKLRLRAMLSKLEGRTSEG